MSEIQGLIDKHRANGILLDTNLLVLYLVGKINPRRIPTFKRTRAFREADFDLLAGIVAQFKMRLATPGIWAEVSNLTDLQGDEHRKMRRLIHDEMQLVTEHYTPSCELARMPAFHKLGITDAAIAELSQRPLFVLTADLSLYRWLSDQGADSFNFNHIRPL
jgi:hypothetical protein